MAIKIKHFINLKSLQLNKTGYPAATNSISYGMNFANAFDLEVVVGYKLLIIMLC